jgi:cytochrome bd ubiquinol oxidase subunit II
MPEIYLPVIWGAVVAFSVFMYVLMDGFDLGIGILFPALPGEAARDTAMNSVAPIWDGNETWLVLGGGGLLAAFPLAYAVLMPALYLPILAMIIALIFRGVAFEFRFKVDAHKRRWSAAFHIGSLIATFAQGMVLGAFVQGIPVEGRQYAGGAMDWLTPFSAMTGFALLAGYGLLGATWLVWKTEGGLRDWARRAARWLTAAVLVFMAAVSLWVPLRDATIADRWFSWPNLLFLSPVPLLTAAAALGLVMAVQRGRDLAPFLLAMALFALGYAGLGISLWPNVVTPDLSLWEAAAPPSAQEFMLVGVAILMPVILGYTAYAYWVFRGKVPADAGYH